MKWLELHLDTQPAGIEPATELLSEYGIDSLMIDEEGDFKDFLENNHQYWDYVDDELMEQMHGKSRITFYLEDSAEGYNTLAQFRIGLSAFKKQHPEYAPLILSMEMSKTRTGRTTGSSSTSPWRSASGCSSCRNGSRRRRTGASSLS